VRPRQLAKYRLPGICLALIGLMTVFVGVAMLAIGDDSGDNTQATTKGVVCIVVGGVLLLAGFLQQHIVHRKHKRQPKRRPSSAVPCPCPSRAANYVSSSVESDVVVCDISDGEEGGSEEPTMKDVPIWFTPSEECVDVRL